MYRFALMISVLLLWGLYAQASPIADLSQAVNIAGKQRMYTQRMLKDYAMVGMHNTFGDPKKDLQETMHHFEAHLKALQAFAPTPEIKQSLDRCEKLWNAVKSTLQAPPKKENAPQLQRKLDTLLACADDATRRFAEATGKRSGEIINISGRQRMLSQRMASLYMLKVWGIEDPMFTKKMNDAMGLFKTSLQRLIAYERNTPRITGLLQKVRRSFMFFEIMNRSSRHFIPTLIYQKSNQILKDMDTVTGLYADMGSKEKGE